MPIRIPDWVRYEILHFWEGFQHRTHKTSARAWINTNPRKVTAITAVSVLLLLTTIVLLIPEETMEKQNYEKAWFYDLNTGKLFVANSKLSGPIKAPSGPLPNGEPAGVRAYVFTYVHDPNDSERFIAFLERPDPNADHVSNSSHRSGAQLWSRPRLVRSLEDGQWVPADSDKGQAILKKVLSPNEKGEIAHYCPPE